MHYALCALFAQGKLSVLQIASESDFLLTLEVLLSAAVINVTIGLIPNLYSLLKWVRFLYNSQHLTIILFPLLKKIDLKFHKSRSDIISVSFLPNKSKKEKFNETRIFPQTHVVYFFFSFFFGGWFYLIDKIFL